MQEALPYLLDLLERWSSEASASGASRDQERSTRDLIDLIERHVASLTPSDADRFRRLTRTSAADVTVDDLVLDGFEVTIDHEEDVASVGGVEVADPVLGTEGRASAASSAQASTSVSLDDFDVGALLGASFGATPPNGANRSSGDASSVDDATVSDDVRAERRALSRLEARRRERDLETYAEDVGHAWQADRSRETARLLYATNRNYAKYKSTSAFAGDPGLRRFAVAESLLNRNDQLVSFSSVETAVGIVTDVVAAVHDVATHKNSPLEHRSDAFAYVERLALSVARDPYAGRSSPFEEPGLTLTELRKALTDLERERLPDWQKRMRRDELEPLLARRELAETQNRSILKTDVARFVDLVTAFFDDLAWWVPTDLGGRGTASPTLREVVFGLDETTVVRTVSDAADAITFRLSGPLRFRLLGRDAAASAASFDKALYVGDASILLDVDRVTFVGDAVVETFVEGEYVHVRLREADGSWVRRAAVATVAVRALAHPDRTAALALLVELAGDGMGDPATLASKAASVAARIAHGSQDGEAAVQGWVRSAATRIGRAEGESWPDAWTEPLLIAAVGSEADATTVFGWWHHDVHGAEEPVRGSFTGERTQVVLGGRSLAFERVGGGVGDRVVALRPGGAIGAFRSVMVAEHDDGLVMAASGGGTLMVGFVPGLTSGRSEA